MIAAMDVPPDEVLAFLSSGIALWDAGRHDEAMARFDEAARFRPVPDPGVRAVVAEAVTAKARGLYTLERYEQALPVCEQVIADYADDPDPRLRTQVIRAYSVQAAALGDLGRRDEQIRSHLQMLQRYQDSEDGQVRESVVLSMTAMIFALSEVGDHGGAVKVFNRILGDYGSDPNPAVASALKLAESAVGHSVEADRRRREGPARVTAPETVADPAHTTAAGVDTARIDALARAAEGGGDLAAMTALWTAAFELDQWCFLARGDLENARPFVGVYDGQPFVLAFTTSERVRDFAVANGYASADDSTYSITMTPDAVVEVADAWAAQGIHAITFDHGVTGFFAPLANLGSIRAHVRGG
jgi:tetratricopeptide (TPR) repeat protein